MQPTDDTLRPFESEGSVDADPGGQEATYALCRNSRRGDPTPRADVAVAAGRLPAWCASRLRWRSEQALRPPSRPAGHGDDRAGGRLEGLETLDEADALQDRAGGASGTGQEAAAASQVNRAGRRARVRVALQWQGSCRLEITPKCESIVGGCATGVFEGLGASCCVEAPGDRANGLREFSPLASKPGWPRDSTVLFNFEITENHGERAAYNVIISRTDRPENDRRSPDRVLAFPGDAQVGKCHSRDGRPGRADRAWRMVHRGSDRRWGHDYGPGQGQGSRQVQGSSPQVAVGSDRPVVPSQCAGCVPQGRDSRVRPAGPGGRYGREWGGEHGDNSGEF